MTSHDFSIGTEVDDDAIKIIEDGLNEFNEMHVGPDPSTPIWIICRDDSGHLLGGIQGFVRWDWFVIATLWIGDENRGQGIGSRLLSEAEEAARQRGCTRCRLATLTFQAPEFYEKYGYEEMCRLADVPPGHSLIWMAKTLSL